MEQIGFISALDIKDLLLNISKILTTLGKKILIVDATSMQRFRYVAPMTANPPSQTFVSEYCGIDVALGFMNLNGIVQYQNSNLQYDYIFIYTDNPQTLNTFMIPRMQKIFFATSYDLYDLNRGIEILKYIQQPTQITRVILSSDVSDETDNYFLKLTEGLFVKWTEYKIDFLDEIVNRNATLINQLQKDISIKNFSNGYKMTLEYLISLMTDGKINQSDINRTIKKS